MIKVVKAGKDLMMYTGMCHLQQTDKSTDSGMNKCENSIRSESIHMHIGNGVG